MSYYLQCYQHTPRPSLEGTDSFSCLHFVLDGQARGEIHMENGKWKMKNGKKIKIIFFVHSEKSSTLLLAKACPAPRGEGEDEPACRQTGSERRTNKNFYLCINH